MKKLLRYSLIIILCVLGGVAYLVVRDVDHMNWVDHAEADVDHLASGIKAFRENYGIYPDSISTLVNDPGFSYMREISTLPGCPESRCEYLITTNGFTITIAGPGTIFHSQWRYSKEFEYGAQ